MSKTRLYLARIFTQVINALPYMAKVFEGNVFSIGHNLWSS